MNVKLLSFMGDFVGKCGEIFIWDLGDGDYCYSKRYGDY